MPGRWLLERYPRDTQPGDASRLAINPRFPRPVFVHVASVPRRDLISGRFGTHPATDTYGASRHGIALRTTRSNTAGLSFGTYQPIKGDRWTVLVLANPPADSLIHSIYNQRPPGAPSAGFMLAANMSSGFQVRNGGVALACQDQVGGGQVFGVQSTSTSLIDGRFHVYAARRAGSTSQPEIFFDGVQLAVSSTGTPASTVSTSQETKIGGIGGHSADSNYSSNAHFPIVVAWSDYLSDRQLATLGRSLTGVWRVFDDEERRIWVPAAPVPTVISATTGTGAGAGTTASVSARTIIAATVGTASGEGTVATVAARTVIAAGVGEATGAGTAAVIGERTRIAATVGEARGEGTQAGIVERVVIAATAPGTATGAGTSAQIAEHTTIAAGVGEAQGEGTTATLAAGGKVLATVGTARGEGTTATIRTTDRIAANVGEARGAGTQARIAEHTRIAAGVGVAEGQGSTAQIIMPTRIAAVAGVARGLGTAATVAEHTRIAASVGEGAGEGTAAIIDVVIPGGGGATASQIWAHMLPHGMTARQTMAALHAMLAELHQVHGLRAGVPLVVSPTERRSGDVVQSIAESGGVVTMERAS